MSQVINVSKPGDVVTISNKGWVVIPVDLRKKYDLHPGKSVTIIDYGGVLAIVPLLADPINQMQGLLAGKSSLTKALLTDRREEKLREQ